MFRSSLSFSKKQNNKNNYDNKNIPMIKSNIEEYLSKNTIPWSHAILISKANPRTNHDSNETLDRNEMVPIEMVVPETDIKIKRNILIIEKIDEVDFIRWLETIEEISVANNWDDDKLGKLVCNLIRDEKCTIDMKYREYNYLKTRPVKDYFNEEKSWVVYKKLEGIQQKDYVRIKEYVKDLSETAKEYKYCTKMTEKEFKRFLKKDFLRA
ncbi:MAG: hypothetical protein ACRCZW_00430 [Lactobacillaceae bacterium]